MNECSKAPAHGTAEPDDVKQSSSGSGFKLTYATMFDSPPESMKVTSVHWRS